jgi:L-threonylcarbamoyladenylate synthase
METRVRKITNNEEMDRPIYMEAGEILRNGGLVAFPTETVYGLGANALDAGSCAKIYAAKGRPSDNPLIVHIADIEALHVLCSEIPPMAEALAKAFWPGPLTMIFKKKPVVPDTITGGLDTVAVRMPVHPVAMELIRTSGVYIAAPSANISGRPSPTTAAHVQQDMDGRIDMLLDGGSVEIGIESTIVDVTGEIPVILRPGYITKEMLEAVAGEVETDRAITEQAPVTAVPKAPGMKYRHYAPKGDLTIVECEEDITKAVDYINRLAAQKMEQGARVGILATDETKQMYQADVVLSVGKRTQEISVSSHLFAALRTFDDEGAEYIFSESFSRKNVGMAIMNRLMKAAGGKIIRI